MDSKYTIMIENIAQDGCRSVSNPLLLEIILKDQWMFYYGVHILISHSLIPNATSVLPRDLFLERVVILLSVKVFY